MRAGWLAAGCAVLACGFLLTACDDQGKGECRRAARLLGASDNLADIECDRQARQRQGGTVSIVNDYAGSTETERACIDVFRRQGLPISDTSAVKGLPVGSADQPFEVTFTTFYSDQRPATRARCKGQMRRLNSEVASATMEPL